MKKLQWDKVRILVANYCNYKCPFCHNEGQDKTTTKERMSLQSFRRLVDILSNQPISEFNISGGEPFLNEDIVDMILYGNDNLDCDISCATNLSLIKPEHINALSGTRIKFNIQFPFATAEAFKRSTVTGNLDRILTNKYIISIISTPASVIKGVTTKHIKINRIFLPIIMRIPSIFASMKRLQAIALLVLNGMVWLMSFILLLPIVSLYSLWKLCKRIFVKPQ